MTIIYVLSKIISIPGAIVKGFWEQVFCRAFKSPVESNDYIRMDELCGHVGHELIPTSARSFWYNFLPGYFNFGLGFTIASGPFINLLLLDVQNTTVKTVLYAILLWIGLSLLSNIFPLREDALNMWEKIYGKGNSSTVIGKIFFFIPALIMLIGSFLEAYGITVILNIAMVAVLLIL